MRMFKGFLLWYHRLCRELSTTLDEEDVLAITRQRFLTYCGSPDYHYDLAMSMDKVSQNRVKANGSPPSTVDLTVQEAKINDHGEDL